MKAPGTLSDEAQANFSAQIVSLVKGFYGEDAQCALVVLKYVERDGAGGVALYTMGSTDDQAQVKAAFVLAAETLPTAATRKLAIEEGDPQQKQ